MLYAERTRCDLYLYYNKRINRSTRKEEHIDLKIRRRKEKRDHNENVREMKGENERYENRVNTLFVSSSITRFGEHILLLISCSTHCK